MIDIHLVNGLEKKEELLSLYRKAFSHDMSEALWNWKYLDNPASGPRPEVFVAMDDGKIVGARPLWPMEWWLKDSRVRAVQSCDVMVRPEYQGKGLMIRMRQHEKDYVDKSDYVLWLGISAEYMVRASVSTGGKHLFEHESLFKVQNLDRLLIRRFNNNHAINALGFLYSKISGLKPGKTLPPQDFQTHVVDKYTDELAEVDSLRDMSRINLVRDEKYLKWRFDRHPEHTYKYVIAKRGDELLGYAAICARQSSDGLVQGMIIDYLIKNNDINCFLAIINQCLNELNKSNCDLVSIGPHTDLKFSKELIKHFGFHSSIRFPYSIFKSSVRYYFYVYNSCLQSPEKLDHYVYDKRNWYVTYACADNT